ncbi:hypothetical protein AKJ41_04345 [candidate division MSBL1 archaeon SCGC-AAA259O05]|uniref:Uroporphyrinogen decarboxylase (URO-D) domain-containing protein n=1 Tax=candidate division MSBL1 archaeon SCGC-AAA259O05 TaxID=1698271 RepID=A0A133V154_9EURY|nr:hypothetical protein AKJ41_04345 [candidate division MSBL1 archaeon SCGC-AAA259O05]
MDLDAYFMGSMIPQKERTPEKIDEKTWRFEDENTKEWRTIKLDFESGFCGEVDSNIKQNGIEAFEKHVERLEREEYNLSEYDLEPYDYVVKEIGEKIAIFGNADVSIPSGSSWLPIFLKCMIKRPELVERYLDEQLQRTMTLLEEQLDRNIFGVWGGVDWAGETGPFFSPEHFDRFVKPRLHKIVEKCHENNVPYVKHTDGNIKKILESLLIETDTDGYNAIEPKAGMDIFQLKKDWPRRPPTKRLEEIGLDVKMAHRRRPRR